MTTLPERETCWTTIRRAAEGDAAARGEFARNYVEPLRAYFAARWRGGVLAGEIEDAVQDVFVDCFEAQGALGRAAQACSFRAFLAGVARNVALRAEEKRARDRDRAAGAPSDFDRHAGREETASAMFDRAWARSIMRQAADALRARAQDEGGPCARRVELLRLRFEEGLPIREIARRWNGASPRLHHEYALAREDFRRALLEIVGGLETGSAGAPEVEVQRLLALLAGPRSD